MLLVVIGAVLQALTVPSREADCFILHWEIPSDCAFAAQFQIDSLIWSQSWDLLPEGNLFPLCLSHAYYHHFIIYFEPVK